MRYHLLLLLMILVGCSSPNQVNFSWDPVDNIDYLWQTIDTKYCFLEEKGIRWDDIHSEYIQKAQRLQKNDKIALFDLCAAMLDSLHDGHVNIYTPFDISRSTSWYEDYPTNFNANLQQAYLKQSRQAGGLQYAVLQDDSIGYIYYSSFSNTISSNNLYWVFSSFKGCKGIILDVRHNGGGDLSTAYLFASAFTKEDVHVGYWQHKNGPSHSDYSQPEKLYVRANDCPNKWLRPVVVLTNRHSYSATNFFIMSMSQLKNVAIIGGVSGGGGGMPLSYEMPCGWTLRLSSIKMYDPNMNSIEEGIVPDLLVTMQSDDTNDRIIEKAIDIIKRNTK